MGIYATLVERGPLQQVCSSVFKLWVLLVCCVGPHCVDMVMKMQRMWTVRCTLCTLHHTHTGVPPLQLVCQNAYFLKSLHVYNSAKYQTFTTLIINLPVCVVLKITTLWLDMPTC